MKTQPDELTYRQSIIFLVIVSILGMLADNVFFLAVVQMGKQFPIFY